MKTSFSLLIAAFSLIILSSCNKEDVRPKVNDQLELRFENISEEKIKNFTFQGKSIGNISKGSKTKYYNFESIKVLENLIYEEANVKSEYGTVESWLLTPGVEHETLNSGKHTIEVSLFYGCGVGFMLQLAD